jgi:hypothetical protein
MKPFNVTAYTDGSVIFDFGGDLVKLSVEQVKELRAALNPPTLPGVAKTTGPFMPVTAEVS